MKLDLADTHLNGTVRLHHHTYADLLAAAKGGCELCQSTHGIKGPTYKGHDDYPDSNLYWELFPKRKDDDLKADRLIVRIFQRHPSGLHASLEAYVDEGNAILSMLPSSFICLKSASEF